MTTSKLKEFPLKLVTEALKAKGGTGRLEANSFNSATDEELIKQVQSAVALYPALRSLAYRMPSRREDDGSRLSRDEMVCILENIADTSIAASPVHPRHEDWIDRRSKIPELVDSAIARHKGVSTIMTGRVAEEIMKGDSLMTAPVTRPIGPQRETTPQDIERRVAEKQSKSTTKASDIIGKSKSDTASSDEVVELHVAMLNAATIPPVKYIVPGMIPEQGITSLAGMSNVGKTRWLASLTLALAVGDTARTGLPQAPGAISTLWIANEERVDDIARRIKAGARQHGDKKSASIFVRGKGSGMLRLVAINEAGNLEIDEDNVAMLVIQINESGAKFLIFDPYVTLSDATDENSSASAAMITKAMLLIISLTGVAIMHAHHTPKDRNKDVDWTRGDASAWRGSGAIYSALDCGFTLSNWMPKQAEQRKSWKNHYLSAGLSRFIVLDTGKIREGKSLEPVVMELVGQEMAKGEGDEIGVCRLANEAQAANALLDVAIDTIAVSELAYSMVEKLGEGQHKVMVDIHGSMKGVVGWPNGERLQGRDLATLCSGEFTKRWVKVEGDYSVKFVEKTGKGTVAKWMIVIKKMEPEAE
jgi:hypothetical protein